MYIYNFFRFIQKEIHFIHLRLYKSEKDEGQNESGERDSPGEAK